MRVLLINPKYPNFYVHGPQENIRFPPLGLEYLAGKILDIADVQIIDNRLKSANFKYINKTILQFKPDYVGISCNYSSQIYIAQSIAKIAKNLGSTTVIGGWHPTLSPRETLKSNSIDIVIRGEGENTFRELILKNSPIGILGLSYKQNEKQIHNPDRNLMDLRENNTPARHIRSSSAKSTYSYFGFTVDCIETSRGCPYTCKFCCIHHFYKNSYRRREVEHIIKELKSNEIKKKATLIFIVDDNFFVDRKFVLKLCDAIIKNGIKKYFMAQIRVDIVVNYPEVLEKMAEAGFTYLFLGIESFSDKTLNKLDKKLEFEQIKLALKILHKLGYIIHGNIIIGANLKDKKEDLESTIKIAKELDIELLTFSLLTPFPGTQLMDRILKKNLLLSKNWSHYNMAFPVIKYEYLSSNELEYYLNKAYKETWSFKKAMLGIRRLLLNRGMKYHLSRINPIDLFKLTPMMINNSGKLLSYLLNQK